MRRLVIAALAMTLAACSTDATGPYGSVNGSYSLTRLDGSYLPYTFSNGLTLVSDDLTLYSDGTYTDISRYSGGSTRQDQGYYSNNNGALTFQASSGVTFSGSISGNVLTEFVGGYTQTFERR